jgi:transposase-like protein
MRKGDRRHGVAPVSTTLERFGRNPGKRGSRTENEAAVSKQFHREAIRWAQLGDTQLVKDLGISDATLHNWLKQEKAERGPAPGRAEPGRAQGASAAAR